MNQNAITLKLIDFTDEEVNPYGTTLGKLAFSKFISHLDTVQKISVVAISFGNVSADSSYLREAVISVIKHYRNEKFFYVTDLKNADVRDNCHYAAEAKKQPVIAWEGDEYWILGPQPSPSNLSLLELVLKKRSVTTAWVATELDISVQNASTKLKRLVEEGYIMRREEAAESGGIEYVYAAICLSD
ncbi:DNA-binding protein [Pseudomonas tructae]|uniref:DNA-binding protein n=1 Tax=Pseudomonas tructae TaxID=2518644 RepID=A0A411MC79_9PSED|nr:MarR family transcriptional regulator [Pseudomonas tructae]QBF24408.1 DNA-binding protein [Pseudomonas tructae]